MDKQPLIVGADRAPRQRAPVAPERVWNLATWFGLLFVVVGLVDLGLGLIPADWSTAPARFTAVTSAAGGLPILTLGLLLWTAGAAANDTRLGLGLAGLVGALVALLVVVGLVIMVTTRAETIAAAPAEVIPVVRKTVWRTLLFGVCMGTAVTATAATALAYWRSGPET